MGVIDSTLVSCTRAELAVLFSKNLADYINDEKLKTHIISILEEYAMQERSLPIREEKPDTLINRNLLEKKDYDGLMKRGDAYLFLCGWFPEYAIKRKRSPGIDFYIVKGMESYRFARALVSQKQMVANKEVPFKLEMEFTRNIKAIMHAKENITQIPNIDPHVVNQLYASGLYNIDVQKRENDYKKQELYKKMEARGISIIK